MVGSLLSARRVDLVVVGVGIVVLAVARLLLLDRLGLSLLVVEKEARVAPHPSNHNSTRRVPASRGRDSYQ